MNLGTPSGTGSRSPRASLRRPTTHAGWCGRRFVASAAPTAVVALLLLGGCGGGEAPAAGPEPEVAAPTTTTAVPPTTAPPPSVGTSSARLSDLEVDEAPSPVSIRIDEIGVDAAVTPVGVDEAGDFDVPAPDVVGWYQHGPSPGEAGSAVLAGHVDYGGERGVFFDLDRLAPGSGFTVTYDDGSTQAFVVTALQRHPKDELPDALFAREGPPTLALITCGGAFDPDARSYLDNVVALAEPVA